MTFPPEIKRTERNRQVRWKLGKVEAVRDAKLGIELTVQLTAYQSRSLPYLKPEVMEDLAEVARAAAVNAGGSSLAGKSLIQGLWEELDSLCDRIFNGIEDDGDRARADQMAWVIAYFTNPYRVERENIVAIKKEARARWEYNNA